MQKVNRIVKTVVAVLLSLVLITTCLVSGIFAKYVKKGDADFSIKLKEWGVTISSNTDLRKEYTSDGNVVVKSSTSINSGKDNIIMPGSSGRFAYFRINGSPEVAYSVDFSGNINIGDGYTSYIEDAKGNAIEYFPIRFRYVAYDVSTVGGEEVLTKVDALTSPLITVKRTDVQGNEHYFDDNALDSIDVLESLMNSDSDISLNMAFDDIYSAPGTSINRIYALEWEWLYHYDTEEEVAAGKTENNREATAEGNYQTRELDTKLGEAIVEKYNEFNISVDMGVTVKQVTGELPYELFTEDGVKKIKFGSYPQSLVSDSDLATTLSSKAGTLPSADNSENWTSYGYYQSGTNTKDYMWYIDVENGEDKYRGVYFTEYRPSENYPTSSAEDFYQGTNGYSLREVYWFKYDPVEWTILEETSRGTAFLLCDMVMDSQAWQDTYKIDPADQHSKKYNPLDGEGYQNPYGWDRIYANNYEYSTIRQWLNETFYETAFSELQASIILDTYIDNSLKSTGNKVSANNHATYYVSYNTLDKVFMLSYEEAKTYVDQSKAKTPTAYAMSQGSINHKTYTGCWWLRSYYCRSGDNYTNTYQVRVLYGNNVAEAYGNTWDNYVGIVPALWIKL